MLQKIARVFLAAFLSVALLVGSVVSNHFGFGEALVRTPPIVTPGWTLEDFIRFQKPSESDVVAPVRQSTPPVLVAKHVPSDVMSRRPPEVGYVPLVQQGILLVGPPLWVRDSAGLYQIALAFFMVAHQNFLPDLGAKWQAWSQPEDMLYPPLEARVRKQIEPAANVRKRHPSYYSHKA